MTLFSIIKPYKISSFEVYSRDPISKNFQKSMTKCWIWTKNKFQFIPTNAMVNFPVLLF